MLNIIDLNPPQQFVTLFLYKRIHCDLKIWCALIVAVTIGLGPKSMINCQDLHAGYLIPDML